MENSEEKIRMISDSVVGWAENEKYTIVEAANEKYKKELASCKEQLIDAMFHEIQQKTGAIRKKTVMDKAQAELEARRTLLELREKLTVSVFSEAAGQLAAYASTPEYKTALMEDIRALADGGDYSGDVVYLREADMELGAQISGILPGAKAEPDASIRLGGFRLLRVAAGTLTDETLDSRLEEQKPWFLMNCGLKVI